MEAENLKNKKKIVRSRIKETKNSKNKNKREKKETSKSC